MGIPRRVRQLHVRVREDLLRLLKRKKKEQGLTLDYQVEQALIKAYLNTEQEG